MNKQRGFTLLELMITVGIVAILAGLAISGYEFATIKSRRAAAAGCLTESAQQMERFYTTTMTYAGASVPFCTADVTDYYTISFAAGPNATAYTLQAVPQGPQTKDSCGTLQLDQNGRKTPTTQGCW
jgi:type IV pilus assembly protein PilE